MSECVFLNLCVWNWVLKGFSGSRHTVLSFSPSIDRSGSTRLCADNPSPHHTNTLTRSLSVPLSDTHTHTHTLLPSIIPPPTLPAGMLILVCPPLSVAEFQHTHTHRHRHAHTQTQSHTLSPKHANAAPPFHLQRTIQHTLHLHHEDGCHCTVCKSEKPWRFVILQSRALAVGSLWGSN